MLLIHQGRTPTPLDPDLWATLSDVEQQGIYATYRQVNETPGVTPGNSLQPPETATTVRVADDKMITTDGPFVATKDPERVLDLRGGRRGRGDRPYRNDPGGTARRSGRGAAHHGVVTTLDETFRAGWRTPVR